MSSELSEPAVRDTMGSKKSASKLLIRSASMLIAATIIAVFGLALTSCSGSGLANSNSQIDNAKPTGSTIIHLSPIMRPRVAATALPGPASVSTTPTAAIAPVAAAITPTAAVPLTASTVADTETGQAPVTVNFDGSNSVGPPGAPLTFSWNFGDQTGAVGATVQHTYSTPGTYAAVVILSDGQTSVRSAPITITVSPAAASRNSSSLFYVSPAVSPGRTVLLQGSGLGGASQATLAQVADNATLDPTKASFQFPSAPDLSTSTVVPILQSTNSSAKITVPGTFAAGIYTVQYQSAAVTSAPISSSLIHAVINLPLIQWWMGRSTTPGSTGAAAYPGQEIDVFGRNFGATPKVWVSSNGNFTLLTVLQSNPYRVSAIIPGSLAAGTYQLWVHNGHGGRYGFSAPATFTVAPLPAPWPSTQFDVTQFGAKGNGVVDDTAAIAAALRAAGKSGQNGGVVYLPAGQYLVSARLSVPANTIVAGAGATSTTITTANLPFANGSIPSLFEGTSHFVIQDLSITSGLADYIVTCPASQGMYNFYGIVEPLAGPQCSDVTLQRLAISHTTLQPVGGNGLWRGGRTLNFQGADIRILNSVVSSQNNTSLYLSEPINSVVLGNTFNDGKNSEIELVDSEATIFAGNSITATDPTGHCVGNQRRIHHVYVADNYIHDCLGDWGEAFTLDTPYFPYWLGHPTEINGATGSLTFSDPLYGPNFNAPDSGATTLANRYIVVVVGGTGLGQMRRVTTSTYTTVSVDSPWVVPLDSTSVIDIQLDKSQNVFFQNRFANASVGVQLYSQAYQNVIDGNVGNNMGGSYCVANDISGHAIDGGPLIRQFEYCYYNEWLNNSFSGNLPDSNANRAHQIPYQNALLGQFGTVNNLSGAAASVTPRDPLVMFVGNAIRDNHVTVNNTIGFVLGWTHPQVPPASLDQALSLDLIIEQNGIQNCQPATGSSNSSPVGIDIYPGAFYSLVLNDAVSGCQSPLWNASQN